MEIVLTKDQWNELYRYMDAELERFAFIFAIDNGNDRFQAKEVKLLNSMDFDYQSIGGLELADHVRPEVIMHAHKNNLVIIEAHNHFGMKWPAAFSSIDIDGLKEIVPLILWRLPGRPYGALVISEDSFDGLVWYSHEKPQIVKSLITGNNTFKPTGNSIKYWIDHDSYQ